MPTSIDTIATLHCTSFGVPFRLVAAGQRALEAMAACVPHGTEFLAEPLQHALAFRADPGTEGLEHLREKLMVHVGEYAPDRVFVHAGVVAHAGVGLLLPGTSFAGKTTLVAELVRAGAVYYSDEYAVLDAAGTSHPYTRDLQMREPGRPEQRALPLSALHGMAGRHPLPIALVLLTTYEAGAVWRPVPMTPGMAMLELIRHTLPVQRTPARVLATLGATIKHASAFHSLRGESSAVIPAILQALASGEALV